MNAKNYEKMMAQFNTSYLYTKEEGRRIQNYGMSHGLGNIKQVELAPNDSFKVTYYYGEAVVSRTSLFNFTDALMAERSKEKKIRREAERKSREWELSFSEYDIVSLMFKAHSQVRYYLGIGHTLVDTPVFTKLRNDGYKCNIIFRKPNPLGMLKDDEGVAE